MVIIEFRSVLFHHVLRLLHSVLAVQFGHSLVLLLFRVVIDKEIFDRAFASRTLVDGKCRRKLLMSSYLYRVQHGHGKILAVVGDDVVGWPL